MDEPKSKTFSEFALGDTARFETVVTEEMVRAFAELSGDRNPLHTQQAFATRHGHTDIVAHGMLGGALFSRLIGMYLPGLHALYLSQTLNFRKPVYPGTLVEVSGEIIQKVDALKALKIRTAIVGRAAHEVLLDGEALVRVLE